MNRQGTQHQAGSDAHITIMCYLELENKFYNNKMPRKFLNRIFGIGKDAYLYKGSNTNFAADTLMNYTYNQQPFYYNPQIFNYNMGGVGTDYFMNMNTVGHMNVNVNVNMNPAAAQPGANRQFYYSYGQ